MSKRLDSKRILITGAATGIGRATVRAFVAEGAQVVIGDMKVQEGQALADELGPSVSFLKFDAAQESSIRNLVSEAAARLGGLDVLVQNAGVQYSGKVEVFDVEKWDHLMTINVRAYFLGAKYAIPHLRASGGGSIINMASAAGKRGSPGMSAYAASKGAVVLFTSALARELAVDKIRVNAVCPGWVDTPFNAPAIANLGGLEAQERLIKTLVPMGRQAVPEEIAPMFVYLASDESTFMTAQAVVIDGGVTN